MFYGLLICVTLILGLNGHPVWAAVLGFLALFGALQVAALRAVLGSWPMLESLDGDDE